MISEGGRDRGQRDTDGDGTVDFGESYVYDGTDIVLDFVDADGEGAAESPELAKRYLWGPAVDQLLAQEDATGTGTAADVVWPLTDHLGTVRDLVDSTAAPLTHYQYDTYGNITAGDTTLIRYLFTSQEYDLESGLYYYDARYYDPATGRFINEDLIGFDAGDANFYRYVGNGPIGATDPDGLEIYSKEFTIYGVDHKTGKKHAIGKVDMLMYRPDWVDFDESLDRLKKKYSELAREFPGENLFRYYEGEAERLRRKWENAFSLRPNSFNADAMKKDVQGLLQGLKDAGPMRARRMFLEEEAALGALSQALAKQSEIDAAAARGSLVLLGLSLLPGVGEALDFAVLADPNSSNTDRLIAGGSLFLSLVTGGFSPNFGAAPRGARAALRSGDVYAFSRVGRSASESAAFRGAPFAFGAGRRSQRAVNLVQESGRATGVQVSRYVDEILYDPKATGPVFWVTQSGTRQIIIDPGTFGKTYSGQLIVGSHEMGHGVHYDEILRYFGGDVQKARSAFFVPTSTHRYAIREVMTEKEAMEQVIRHLQRISPQQAGDSTKYINYWLREAGVNP